jgi:mannose-6-phosphate isomerase-like protein (cupin superfamily)
MYLIEYREVGDGPGLHKHPYAETWVVRSGNARFTVGGEIIEAGDGAILVGPAEVPHMFENVGPGTLNIICIHPSPRFIQEDLS